MGARLIVTLRTVVLAAILLLPVAIVAGWLEKIAGTSGRPTRPASAALESVFRYVRGLPVKADAVALATQATPEGHWRFVNKAGEMLTVGTPDEMKRLVAVLYPEAKAGARLALYMTPDSVLRDRAALKALPTGADLNIVAEGQSYRLLRRSEGAGERWFAEIGPGLVVEMTDRRAFEEALWQLGRRLGEAGIRVLALEPGGPSTLAPSPRIDAAGKRALVDAVDPASLVAAMREVAGQTLAIVGRLERDTLYFKPSSGPERGLSTKDLLKAAGDADVNLIMLASPTSRQPGGRNGLWPTPELQNARVADLLNALAGPSRRFAVVAQVAGKRTLLDAVPVGDLGSIPAPRPGGEVLANAVAELTGRVAVAALQAHMRSAEHQRELDQRILPGIPSEVQIAYGVLLAFGLLGVPLSRTWWQRVWPPEVAGDYAGRTGYWAARATRGLAFALVFVPLTAPVSAPYNLGRQIREAAVAPLRLWRRLAGAGEGRQEAPPPVPVPAPGPAAARRDMDEAARRAAQPSVLGDDRPRFLSR